MDPVALPTDVAALQHLLVKAIADRARAEEARARLQADVDRERANVHRLAFDNARLRGDVARAELVAKDLQDRMDALVRALFGRRTERVADNQLLLFDPDAVKAAEAAAAADKAGDDESEGVDATPPAPPKRRRKRRSSGGRRKLPAHLERIEVTSAETGPTSCEGCGGTLTVIGHDRAERLDYVPAKVRVVVTVREKRVCSCCPARGVVMQPVPRFALDRALCGDSLLAKVLTDKFADHLPLNRQAKRFRREAGVDIAVSTMCGWVRRSAELLQHVVDAMAEEMRAGHFIQSDATGFPVLEGPKNSPRRGHLWSYTDGTQVVMKASMDGQQRHPADFLDGFQGTLLTDGAGAYNAAGDAAGVVRAGCWSHARRKFFEARKADPARAASALSTIRQIFVLERDLAHLSPENRARNRRRTLGPLLERFREDLDHWSSSCRPKSPLGRAITYARRQWDTLVVFLEDGHAPPHNNTSERLLRSPVIGRKNWLFAGSAGGAHAAAVHYSIVLSCELAGIDPLAYLRDVLGLLPDAKPAQVRELTPLRWAARFGETDA